MLKVSKGTTGHGCKKSRRKSLETIEINSNPENPYQISQNAHAVLTLEYNPDPNHPTHRIYRRVVEFFKEKLANE